MSTISDKTIIENTHFKEEDDKLICYTLLPNDDKFEQQVTSAEAVQKNMIGWCNTVREYLDVKERQREDAILRARRDREFADTAKTVIEQLDAAPVPTEAIADPKGTILRYYDDMQTQIDQLGEQIEALKEKRNSLRDERDKLQPVITVWRGE